MQSRKKLPSCGQNTLKNSGLKPSNPGDLLFFMFLRAVSSSDFVMGCSMLFLSVSVMVFGIKMGSSRFGRAILGF